MEIVLTFAAAIVLTPQIFSGSEKVTYRDTRGWLTADAGLTINNGGESPVHLVSTNEYGDVHVHAEFKIPKGSNSGIYLQGRYEVQILDSSGIANDKLQHSDCGGIYQRWKDEQGYEGKPPLVNAFRGPGEWNVYDIYFRAPRFDSAGKKIQNARFEEVRLNGVVVQKDVECTGPTRAPMSETEVEKGPIMLQGDHGPIEYRNVWARPLPVQAVRILR